jgi:hypothetical protein
VSEVDDAIAAARSSWSRISTADDGIAIADAAILIAAVVIGMIVPLGIMGALFVMLALIATTVFLAVQTPREAAPPPPEKLRTVDLKVLPAQTQRWLAAQRDKLPTGARGVVDRIATRLAVLSPQLGKVDAADENAYELRRLIGEQLPAFVNDYAQVPATLRDQPRNGKSPDEELVDGLTLIEREIADMTERLAQGDLDSLATRGRYLEMKYRGDSDAG